MIAQTRAAGYPELEIADQANAGRLWCHKDQAWHPAADFTKDRSTARGYASSCRRSRNASRRNLRRRRSDDRGSVSVFLVAAVPFLVLAVALGVDLSGKVHTLQLAQDIARQAARAASEAALGSAGTRGDAAVINPAKGVAAAQAYLAASGVPGTVSIQGSTVTVTTTLTYQPVLASVAGAGTQTVTGTSTAQLTRAFQGATQ